MCCTLPRASWTFWPLYFAAGAVNKVRFLPSSAKARKVAAGEKQ